MRLNPFRKKRRRRRSRGGQSWLKAETKQAIVGVLLIIASIIIAFSFFDQAGRLGESLLNGLRRVVGWLAFVTPLFGVYVGWRLLRPNRAPLERWRVVGLVLLIVGLLGLFHVVGVPLDDSLQVAYEGRGGGFLGFMLSYPLSAAVSTIVAGLIFAAALTVGVFLTFNLSPAEVMAWLRDLVPQRPEKEEDTEEEEGEDEDDGEEEDSTLPRFRMSALRGKKEADPDQLKLDQQHTEREKQQEQARRQQLRAANKKYNPPPLELLATSTRQPEGGDVDANKEIIKNTLENFGISVDVGKAKVGPTVTQYTLRPDEGIRLSQITALQNDLARALKAHPVRIEAPIPNTDLVGIEIPNKEVALVRLRDMLASKEMKRAQSPLAMALGRDVSGVVKIAELDRMPHMLIAGATNSGKSVNIHSILMALLYRNSPQLLRLILIDPKRVELAAYNGIPHLWGEPVIVDTGKALNALKWALREMDRRYKLLEESGTRNLLSYNISNPDSPLPFIVIVIDELADLMAKHARDVEGPIVRLSQLARAVGVHLILATQRPSVNVITGLIKANIPARLAFKVASQVDSRTIIDSAGAEKLVGTGDMLYSASDNTKPTRLQGGFVSEEEVRSVVEHIVEHNQIDPAVEEATESITDLELGSGAGAGGQDADDELFIEAKRIAVETGKISASLLQRRLRVGYARAARLLDMLEEQGIIGPAEGNKPREILVGSDDESFGDSKPSDPDPSEDEDEDLESPSHSSEDDTRGEPW
ncbi:cell division protein FtsK [bacterium]|nr:cell division protein FtsK [bacterium]